MRKILSFLLMTMISTSLVFAHETKLSHDKEMTSLINLMDQAFHVEKSSNFYNVDEQNKLLTRIERKIQITKKSDKTLSQEIAKYTRIYEKFHKKQARQTKRILRSQRKTQRLFQKALERDASLTLADFKQSLLLPVSLETKQQVKNLIAAELTTAGSVANYLELIKESVTECRSFLGTAGDDGTVAGENQTWYLILLIVFLGLPILSIIGALFAVIFAAWWWALGLFVFAVVMLGIFFIMAQIGKGEKHLTPCDFSTLDCEGADIL